MCYSQTSARFLHHHLDQDNENFLQQDPRRPPLEIPELMQAQNGMRKAPNSPCWVSFDNKVMIWQFLRTSALEDLRNFLPPSLKSCIQN